MIDAPAPPRLWRWRRRRLRDAGVAAAMLALGAILPAGRPLPFDLCLWHRLTGWNCPGCGLTRSVCHLLQGDLAGSVALHPAGVVVVLLAVTLLTVRLFEFFAGEPLAPGHG